MKKRSIPRTYPFKCWFTLRKSPNSPYFSIKFQAFQLVFIKIFPPKPSTSVASSCTLWILNAIEHTAMSYIYQWLQRIFGITYFLKVFHTIHLTPKSITLWHNIWMWRFLHRICSTFLKKFPKDGWIRLTAPKSRGICGRNIGKNFSTFGLSIPFFGEFSVLL